MRKKKASTDDVQSRDRWSREERTMSGPFASTLGVIAIMGGLLGLAAAPARGQCLANEIQKLTASDATNGDHFGTRLNIFGELLVVGATKGGDVANSGAAYVFRLDQNTAQWAQEQRITPIDPGVGDAFGISEAINPTDPNVIIVGAYLDDDNGGDSGSAYVFRYNPDSQLWAQEQKLTAWDGDGLDHFGFAVSIWGDVAMVGADVDEDPDQGTGSVYVFGYDGPSETWVQQQKLIPADTQFHGRFGWSVSLQGDVALIGAPTDSEQGFGAGAAHIFRYDPKSQLWVQEQKLLASDPEQIDGFGLSVSLDGDTASIGSINSDAPPVFNTGAAYIFRYDAKTSQWTEEQKLTASDGGSGDKFGSSVSLQGDLALIGASLDDDYANGSGSAYIFTLDGTEWNETAKLRYEAVEGVHAFGVSVSTDGEHVVVGANFTTVDGDAEAGAAYMYGGLGDCNENGELDLCDIADGASTDENNNGIPDECEPPPCPWDLDDDTVVGVSDLLSLLGSWGPCPPKGDCPADFDNTGDVGVKDLLILLGAWGACP
jgi:hypothetical protein